MIANRYAECCASYFLVGCVLLLGFQAAGVISDLHKLNLIWGSIFELRPSACVTSGLANWRTLTMRRPELIGSVGPGCFHVDRGYVCTRF